MEAKAAAKAANAPVQESFKLEKIVLHTFSGKQTEWKAYYDLLIQSTTTPRNQTSRKSFSCRRVSKGKHRPSSHPSNPLLRTTRRLCIHSKEVRQQKGNRLLPFEEI
jgi:hypothetical protein